GDQAVQGTSVLPLNTWTFLVGTYDGATMKLYVNGALAASRSMTGAVVSSTDPLRIGGDWSHEMFTGLIDNVRVYNRALSATEIQRDMGLRVAGQPMRVQPAALGAAPPPDGGADVTTALTPQLVEPVRREAVALWAAAGVDPKAVQRLSDASIHI